MSKIYLQNGNVIIIATTAKDGPEGLKEAFKELITEHDLENIDNPDPKAKATINDSHPSVVPFWDLIENSELPKYGKETRVIWRAYEEIDGKIIPICKEIGTKSNIILVADENRNPIDIFTTSPDEMN